MTLNRKIRESIKWAAYLCCQIVLQSEKVESTSNKVQNFLNVYYQKKRHLKKMLKMYERDGTSLNMNKRRLGRRITTKAEENIEVVRQALERNQGRIIVLSVISSSVQRSKNFSRFCSKWRSEWSKCTSVCISKKTSRFSLQCQW